MKSMADQLRDAMRRSGKSTNQIAKAAGVPQTTLSRFLSGKDMSIHRASLVAKHLGLRLERTKP